MNSKKLNILLADDDTDDCYFFDKALKEIPIASHLTFVHDGEELMTYLTKYFEQLPDVLFLDISMPRKNGLECLSEIRQNKKLKELTVVMLSTADSKDTISKVFSSGAHVYIHKPNDFAQLKQVIHHALPIATEKLFSNSPVKYILNA
jgi:CheY-like chemotaxis protein